MKKVAIGILIILTLGVLYWTISLLFIVVPVNDEFPGATEDEGIVDAETKVSSAVPVIGTIGHPASGGVRAIQNPDGSRQLFYENFTTINGPDLFVYLAKDLNASEFISLGRLRGTTGNAAYDIPADVDLSEYRYALTWCKAFSVLFNSADLSQAVFGEKESEACIQVITPARNPVNGEIREFPTPCDVPSGWEVIRNDIPDLQTDLQVN